MSRHEGVSCDSCLKGNFRGKRYKCLVCYDYDLCATCYEAGASTTRHNADHPMQCILTRSDFDLYYGGEAVSVEHPQSFTCPYCGKMGFTEATLTEHCTAEHSDSSVEIVCPICASQTGGEPNHVTDDFASHLTVDHRNRDMDEPSTSRHLRRIPHSGRGMNTARPRRSQMQFTSTSGFSSLSPNSRDSMDPIAELLSQLSSVRRSNLAQSSTTSQLQQLQMQLQMERQQAQVARQQLERIPRRQATTTSISGSSSAGNASLQSNYTVSLEPSSSLSLVNSGPQFLLSRCSEPTLTESEQQNVDGELSDRSLFVQELLLSSLAQNFDSEEWEDIFVMLGLNFESDPPTSARSNVSVGVRSSSNSNSVLNEQDLASAINEAEPAASASSQQLQQQHQNHASVEGDDPQVQNIINLYPRASSNRGRAGRASANNPNCANNRGSVPLRNSTRDGLTGGSRQIGRTGNRESSSPSRRKSHRAIDEKNKTTEPPPPH